LSNEDFNLLSEIKQEKIEIKSEEKFNKNDIVFEDADLFVVNKSP
jgi:23S rRNA-/tRNA-specific pseudouridylate synthase